MNGYISSIALMMRITRKTKIMRESQLRVEGAKYQIQEVQEGIETQTYLICNTQIVCIDLARIPQMPTPPIKGQVISENQTLAALLKIKALDNHLLPTDQSKCGKVSNYLKVVTLDLLPEDHNLALKQLSLLDLPRMMQNHLT